MDATLSQILKATTKMQGVKNKLATLTTTEAKELLSHVLHAALIVFIS